MAMLGGECSPCCGDGGGCCYRESQPPTRTNEANCEEWGWGVQRFDPGFPEIDLPFPGVQGYGIYATQQQAQAAGDAWVLANTQELEGFYDVYTRKLSSFATDEICCDCGGESLPGYADLSITNFTTDDPVLPNFFQGLSMRIPLGFDVIRQVDGSTVRRYDYDPNFACTVYEASLQDPTPCGTVDSTGVYTRVSAPFAGSTNVGFIFGFSYCRQRSPAGGAVPSQPGGFVVSSSTFQPAAKWSSPFLGSECSLPLTTSGSVTLATRGNTYPVDEGLIYTTSFDYTITIPSPSNPLP